MNQEKKVLVWRYWQGMNRGKDLEKLLQFLHTDVIWHGFRPLRRLKGTSQIGEQFWLPLLDAVPDLVRRPYLFIGGRFKEDDWVAGTGDFVGTFAKDWLGIPASGSSIRFRFGEFCKVDQRKIVEIRCIVDLPELMRQSSVDLLPPSYGRDIWIPGPLAGDGLLLEEQDPRESEKTLNLVEEMLYSYDEETHGSQVLEHFWHPDMVWHGPAGIGSAYGLDEFKRNAQGPIVNAFPDRGWKGHRARITEGAFAAATGWPSLVGTHQDDFLGWPATGDTIHWNVMDFWKRDEDLLLENWNLIDLVDAAWESGVDLLGMLPSRDRR